MIKKIYGLHCVKCDEVIVSWYRHDFRQCSCNYGTANQGCFVDGGRDYFRFGGTGFATVEIKYVNFDKKKKSPKKTKRGKKCYQNYTQACGD
jgi:hypothetical protein